MGNRTGDSIANHVVALTTARSFVRLCGLLRQGGRLSDDQYEGLRAAFTADLDVWTATMCGPDAKAEAPVAMARLEEARQLLDDQWSRSGPRG